MGVSTPITNGTFETYLMPDIDTNPETIEISLSNDCKFNENDSGILEIKLDVSEFKDYRPFLTDFKFCCFNCAYFLCYLRYLISIQQANKKDTTNTTTRIFFLFFSLIVCVF